MRHQRLSRWLVVGLALLPAARSDGQDLVAKHLAALAAELPEYAAGALQAVEGVDRRILAARAYVRSEAHLIERWAWSQAKIDAYEGSPAQQLLLGEIDRVRKAFESGNPGHSLFVNPQVRSLEIQLDHWNRNESVGLAARAMLEAIRAAAAAPGFPPPATRSGTTAFRRLLIEHEPKPTPALAAPGLSPHGQMHAVDFQVQQDGRTIASPSTKEIEGIWEALGWRAKLQAAVQAAGAPFKGPLQRPYEPWHYDFRPPAEPEAADERKTP
jgi:hypothetical protein